MVTAVLDAQVMKADRTFPGKVIAEELTPTSGIVATGGATSHVLVNRGPSIADAFLVSFL